MAQVLRELPHLEEFTLAKDAIDIYEGRELWEALCAMPQLTSLTINKAALMSATEQEETEEEEEGEEGLEGEGEEEEEGEDEEEAEEEEEEGAGAPAGLTFWPPATAHPGKLPSSLKRLRVLCLGPGELVQVLQQVPERCCVAIVRGIHSMSAEEAVAALTHPGGVSMVVAATASFYVEDEEVEVGCSGPGQLSLISQWPGPTHLGACWPRHHMCVELAQ